MREMALYSKAVKEGYQSSTTLRRRSSSPGTRPPPLEGLFQGNGSIQIAGGTFNVVSGNSYTYFYLPPSTKIKLEQALRAIPNYRKIHQDTLSKATPCTGMWLFRNEAFRIWLDKHGNIKIILGFGIPGAGKTILAALVIQYLEGLLATEYDRPICVAYAYIRFDDRDQVSVKSLLETFVKQVAERHPDCLSLINLVYARHLQEGTQPTEGELHRLLQSISEKMVTMFLILDAVDEARDKIQLSLVRKLASLNARLFITSRPLETIRAELPGAHAITVVADNRDLDLHIAEKFDAAVGLYGTQDCDPQLKEHIASTVKSRCGGMFLHATLQLEALQQCTTPHDVREMLHRFPSQIEDVYMQTWKRIVDSSPHQIHLVKTALVWVLNASRCMTIHELRHALATCPITYHFSSARLISESTFMAIFRGLLVVDHRSMLVRLVHKTAKGPLEALLPDAFPNPHAHLLAVCITHLTTAGFRNAPFKSQSKLEEALQADPLLAYAHSSWAYHAEQSQGHASVVAQVTEFVAGTQAFPVLTYLDFDLLGPLHLVALSGLPITLAGSRGSDNPNTSTAVGKRLPLGLACWRGNLGVARHLMEQPNILVNAVDGRGVSPLMCAASKGHIDLIELLLAHPEIDVSLVDGDQWTALLKATANGHEGVVRRLLSHPSGNPTGLQRGLAVTLAAWKGYTGLVELFFTLPGIGVNIADYKGRTALMCAAAGGHDSTVEFLLSIHDIEINLVDEDGYSALWRAVENDRKTIIKRLLDHPKIDKCVPDPSGKATFLSACHKGNQEAIEVLGLSLGMDVHPADEGGKTAVKVAAEDGWGMVCSLIAAGDVSLSLFNPSAGLRIDQFDFEDEDSEHWEDAVQCPSNQL